MSTIEKRLEDLEYVIAHLPEYLDWRFDRVSRKLADAREILTVHTTRFSEIDDELRAMREQIDGLAKLIEGRVQTRINPEPGRPRGPSSTERTRRRSHT